MDYSNKYKAALDIITAKTNKAELDACRLVLMGMPIAAQKKETISSLEQGVLLNARFNRDVLEMLNDEMSVQEDAINAAILEGVNQNVVTLVDIAKHKEQVRLKSGIIAPRFSNRPINRVVDLAFN
jgi:hypothetical protein